MIAEGVERVVTLSDVFLATQLACNIMSLANMEKKSFKLSYNGGSRSLVHRRDKANAFDVKTK